MDLCDHEAIYQGAVARCVLRSELLLRCVWVFTAKNVSLLKSEEIWKPANMHFQFCML